ncbi:hypothetical protein UPYG_G00204690 [Umbra pygmaea]|uniref:Centrosomal protein of 57 kDa-like n=1 Tax=Umbra pygmaea TaxID=75934 RepID=A0ABD0X108_UMBPY
METAAKPSVATGREKQGLSADVVMSDRLSLPSYKDYPARRPFVNTALPSYTQKCYNTNVSRHTLPSKAFPESSSAAILSALKHLQEKIMKLELERGRAGRSLHSLGTSQTHTDRTSVTHTLNDTNTFADTNRHTNTHTRRETEEDNIKHSEPNQALVTQLAVAESRCGLLERQLDYMRKMVRNAEADRTTLLKRQVSLERNRPADSSHQAQLEKLELLEQEYQRLTRTQSHAERKIRELQLKLLEEEHQRKLVQNKANQLQTGLEANRILIQSVSLHTPKARSRSREKRPVSKKPAQQSSHTQPHYRLSLGDVPFVAGTSVGCSHSVRANVQSVLSLLKQHQPQLCNARVLCNVPLDMTANGRSSDNGSCSSSSWGEELSDLLLALQDELGHMSLEQQELGRQAEVCVCEQQRSELEREQEALLRRMESKGEQISKLRRHQSQVRRLTTEGRGQKLLGRGEIEVTTTVTTRGPTSAPVKVRPGDRSKNSLQLLRDMRSLQTSLRPDQPQWSY